MCLDHQRSRSTTAIASIDGTRRRSGDEIAYLIFYPFEQVGFWRENFQPCRVHHFTVRKIASVHFTLCQAGRDVFDVCGSVATELKFAGTARRCKFRFEFDSERSGSLWIPLRREARAICFLREIVLECPQHRNQNWNRNHQDM